MWHAPPRDVAILVKDGIPARATLLPRTKQGDPLVHDLHHCTCWIHVHMAVGDGATCKGCTGSSTPPSKLPADGLKAGTFSKAR